MKRLFLVALFFLVSARLVVAVNLDASVRLERQKTGTNPLPVLVIVKATSNVTENGVTIDLGSGWAVSNSVSVSTTGLPSGVSPLPLINNGSGSGSLASFPSGDLNTGVRYGFLITGGIGVNPGTSNNTWIVSTGGNDAKVNVPILGQDQVTVTGKVGALASDFQVGITSNKSSDLSIDEVVSYEINYGSYLSGPTKPLVITGSWSRGTVSGSPTPSVDIVDFVVGSGSTGYGGVLPVVDLVNRKISWTINNFPATTLNRKVVFQLRVNNSYTGQSRVKFDVDSTLSGANVVTTNSSVTNYYQPAVVATATPVVSTNNDAGTVNSFVANPTAAVSQSSTATKIKKIEVVTLSDSTVGIVTESNNLSATVKVSYGLSSSNLKSTITSINKANTNLLNIDGLEPDTSYFFKIEIRDLDGSVVGSDLYTFKTAANTDGPEVNSGSMEISVNNNVIVGQNGNKTAVKSAVMVPGESYALRINLTKSELVKEARIIVRDSQVLGISSAYGAEPNSIAVDLSEIVEGGFVGHLVSPTRTGYYDIVLRVESINGGITENNIGTLRVINHFVLVDSKNKPIENAKVVFYQFNNRKQIFELIPQQSIGINNPSYTEPDGTLNLSLPNGKYRVDVSAIGFKSQQRDFVIGLGDEEKMPIVIMSKESITMLDQWNYYASASDDVLSFTAKYLDELISSNRFFKLIHLWLIVCSLLVAWKFMTKKAGISWWMLPWCLRGKFYRRYPNYGWGKVIDKKSGLPVADADIYLLDSKKNVVIRRIMSDMLGNFELPNLNENRYRITAEKKGYESEGIESFSREGLEMGNITIRLENIVDSVKHWEMSTNGLLSFVVRHGYGAILLLFFILELLLWDHLGLERTWPWVLLAAVNLIIWWRSW